MTSKLLEPASSAFVWTWLPGETDPVVAGRIDLVGTIHEFTYGRSYLTRENAIPLFEPDLPLKSGIQAPPAPHVIAPCLRDGAPDFWGRRVIVNRLSGEKGSAIDVDRLDELNYLLQSGTDRTGALDFQSSATHYVPRLASEATLETLLEAAEVVETGAPLPLDLEEALRNGTSIGGARPKVQITDGGRKFIAKFSSTADKHSVVKGEYIAMRLAEKAGLSVAPVELAQAGGKDVLLIERFDRLPEGGGWTRRHMVSGLTLLGLPEHEARYARYEDLAGVLRRRGSAPKATLRELFARMVFNVAAGNTDDHARNHAAFWTGSEIILTPAYDIDPRPRRSFEANQAMAVSGNNRQASFALALEAAPSFLLDKADAEGIVEHVVEVISEEFDALADEAGLSEVDARLLRNQALLHPFAFDGLEGKLAGLAALADEGRR